MKISKILVPVSNPNFLEEMIRVACNLSQFLTSKIYVLYVVEIPRSLPLDAQIPQDIVKAEEILKKAEDISSNDYGIEIETDILQARSAGVAILEEIEEKSIDLVLLESNIKKTIGERFFGSTVDYVLRKAPCKVWLIRPALK